MVDVSDASRCKETTYCGAKCQKSHWKRHKKSCKKPSKRKQKKLKEEAKKREEEKAAEGFGEKGEAWVEQCRKDRNARARAAGRMTEEEVEVFMDHTMDMNTEDTVAHYDSEVAQGKEYPDEVQDLMEKLKLKMKLAENAATQTGNTPSEQRPLFGLFGSPARDFHALGFKETAHTVADLDDSKLRVFWGEKAFAAKMASRSFPHLQDSLGEEEFSRTLMRIVASSGGMSGPDPLVVNAMKTRRGQKQMILAMLGWPSGDALMDRVFEDIIGLKEGGCSAEERLSMAKSALGLCNMLADMSLIALCMITSARQLVAMGDGERALRHIGAAGSMVGDGLFDMWEAMAACDCPFGTPGESFCLPGMQSRFLNDGARPVDPSSVVCALRVEVARVQGDAFVVLDRYPEAAASYRDGRDALLEAAAVAAGAEPGAGGKTAGGSKSNLVRALVGSTWTQDAQVGCPPANAAIERYALDMRAGKAGLAFVKATLPRIQLAMSQMGRPGGKGGEEGGECGDSPSSRGLGGVGCGGKNGCGCCV